MRICGLVCLLLTLAGSLAAQDTNFALGPQYLITAGSPLFLHPIATPTLSFDSGLTQPQMSEAATEPTSRADQETVQAISAILEEQRRTTFLRIYYNVPQVSVVEIALGEPAGVEFSTPVSISESGVVQFTSAAALRDRGYGVTLAEAAARSKTHKGAARHLYTNDDLERLKPRD